MTALDRAFIKAYAESPVARLHSPGARPREAAADGESPPTLAHAVLESIAASKRASNPASNAVAPRPAAALAPLSTFANATNPGRAVRAPLEVDQLAWPQACCDLLARAPRNWDRFADHLAERLAEGEKCLAIAGTASGDGATTVALAMAKHAAARGIRTVIVDVNSENPALAASCRITPQAGWTEVVDGDRSLDEVLITSAGEGVALVPWRGRRGHAAQPGDAVRIAALFETLKEQFDLVLVDTAPLASPAEITALVTLADAARVDAVYLIRDVRAPHADELAHACSDLQRAGLHVAGTIANFVDPATVCSSRVRIALPRFAGRLFRTRG